jgi:hypothetical protein
MKKVMRVTCEACHGQAVYYGYLESKGTAVPCNKCGGHGWVPAKENFEDIEERGDIQFVLVDGKKVPYADFIAARRAENNNRAD